MSNESLIRKTLEDRVKNLTCPEPDLEQLLEAGRAARRRRAVLHATMAAAAVLVVVIAGFSFTWAGWSGRAQEPVPAHPSPTRAAFRAPPSEVQVWLDALPAGTPPATPYWRAGVLYVHGEQIPAPFGAVDILVAGPTVLVGGYESAAKDAASSQWALVRGDRLEPVPVPVGAHPPGLSVDGRIAYWVQHQETSGIPQFFTWDIETNSALASHTLQGPGPWDGMELLGVDAAGNGYWSTSVIDPHLTRWDIRANTTHPTDLTYDTSQAPEEIEGAFPWMHPEDTYRSPSGAREVFTDSITSDSPSDCCTEDLRVRPVGSDVAVDPKDVTALAIPRTTPETRFVLGEMDGYWVWWESDESLLISVDGDLSTYLVRCPAAGDACQRVADLGPHTPDADPYLPSWSREWGFARAPGSGTR